MVPDRWEQIIQLVEEHGGVTVEQIAQAIEISPATVRRDLARIYQRGLIKRTRGGAEPSQQAPTKTTLAESRKINPTEKELIGRVVAELIEPGDILMIDGGFTTYQVAKNIAANDVTVITNSLDVAHVLAGRENIRLVVIGGELSVESGTTVGHSTEQQILPLSADKAILGADAISPEDGITTQSSLTAQTKNAMIRCSRELIIVADYSKLGRSALYRVSSIENITTLVTDDKADEAIRDAFRNAGVEVLVASTNDTNHDPKGE